MEESLITRYRPQTLDAVWDNDSIKEKWQGYVGRKEFPKSIILEGNYGLGKTSIALIFANDIMRLAAANENGVMGPYLHKFDRSDYEYRHIDEIIDECRYSLSSPIVFFMDEVQMMPTKTQQLLITPIDHCKNLYFIFATTEPNNVDTALKERSDHFGVEAPRTQTLIKEIGKIAKMEGVLFEDDALKELIKLSKRNPRKCIKNIGTFYGCKRPITKKMVQEKLLPNVGSDHIEP